MTAPLDAALAMAGLGWAVFPVWNPRPGEGRCACGDPHDSSNPELTPKNRGKHPVPRGGFKVASGDPAAIRSWWSVHPDASVGVAVAASGLVVLDVDGPEGAQTLAELEASGKLPATLRARTGSGGAHLYYRRPEGLPPGQAIKFMSGLDLIGKVYVVAPPSLHYKGERYEWVDPSVPVAELPAFLCAVLRGSRERGPATPAPSGLPAAPSSVESARAALSEFPPGVKGDGRNNRAYRAAAIAARDWGLNDEQAMEVLREWGARCVPPVDDGYLSVSLANARKYGHNPPGEAAAAVVLADSVMASVSRRGADPGSSEADDLPFVPPTAAMAASAAAGVSPPSLVLTGFADLDSRVGGGLATRALHVVASRTGAGKTGLALGVCLHAARAGSPVLYCSTELENAEVAARLMALASGRSVGDAMEGKVSRSSLDGLPLYLAGCDVLPRGAGALVAARRWAPAVGAVLVCVDYLQGLVMDDDPRSVRVTVSHAADRLRALSQELGCAVLAVSSVARPFYKAKEGDERGDPLTYLAAAKESGDVEFAAANVLYLDVAAECDDGGDHAARLVVAKARRGRAGFVGARFHGPSGRWSYDADGERKLEDSVAAKRRMTDAQWDERVLDAIRSNPGAPWRDVRPGRGAESQRALERLKSAGRVVEVSDPLDRRKRWLRAVDETKEGDAR